MNNALKNQKPPKINWIDEKINNPSLLAVEIELS